MILRISRNNIRQMLRSYLQHGNDYDKQIDSVLCNKVYATCHM